MFFVDELVPEPKRSVADAHDLHNKGQRPSLLIDLLTGDRSHSNKTGENSQSSGQQHTLSSSNVSHELSETTPKGIQFVTRLVQEMTSYTFNIKYRKLFITRSYINSFGIFFDKETVRLYRDFGTKHL